MGFDELKGKRVVVVGSGAEECKVKTAAYSDDQGMEGADCADSVVIGGEYTSNDCTPPG